MSLKKKSTPLQPPSAEALARRSADDPAPQGCTRARHLRAHLDRLARLERLRDAVIDLDIQVDDCRDELVAAAGRLRAALRQRDEAVRQLLAAVEAPRAA